MNYITRKARTTLWLLQSFLSRYKRHFVIAFVVGSIAALLIWQFGPPLYRMVFPERKYVGVIGHYEPTRLPSTIEEKLSSGLVAVSEGGQVEPALATHWEVNKEGTLYFFYLEDDITWHSGEEFSAHDVNYQFREVVIVPGDSHILKIELEEPFAPLPTLLTKPLFKPGLVGVGEYRVVSIELKGNILEKMVLKPFDDPRTKDVNERAGKPIYEYKFYTTPSKAILAYQLGEIDTIENLPSLSHVPEEPNSIITEEVQLDRFVGLFFNMQNEALSGKALRQALSYAIPTVTGKGAMSPIPDTSWAHNGTVKEYKFNLDLANTLLEKSDIPASEVSLIISTFPDHLDLAQEIAASWTSNLGVETSVKVTQTLPREYDVFLGIQEIPQDPDQYALWHSTQDQTNITHYNNPKIDKLLEEGRKEINRDARLEIYLDFQRYLAEDVPVNILSHPSIYTLTRK